MTLHRPPQQAEQEFERLAYFESLAFSEMYGAPI